MTDHTDRQRRVIIDNDRGDRTLWLLLALGIGIVWLIYKFPRTSGVIIAALVGAAALVRLGIV